MGSGPRHSPSGRPVVEGVIGVVMNITELKEKEHDLQTQKREKRIYMANEAAAKEASRAAKEASRLKSQFLANVRSLTHAHHKPQTNRCRCLTRSELQSLALSGWPNCYLT